jgi:MacB-like periplasmic core domain
MVHVFLSPLSVFQQHIGDVAQIAAYDDERVTFSDGGEPLRLEGGRVSSNFFSLLGVRPAMGRDFLPSEDHHGADPVVLLSDRFWRQRYSADPHIVGRTAVIDTEEFTVRWRAATRFSISRSAGRCVA